MRDDRPWRRAFILLLILAGCRSERPGDKGRSDAVPAPDMTLRVLLRGPARDCRLSLTGPFQIRDAAGQVLVDGDAGMADLLVVFEERALRLPQFERVLEGESFAVVARQSEWIGLYLEDGGLHRYRGTMHLWCDDPGGGFVVNHVDIEEYLVSVVACELHRGFHPQAFRVQAIAARTFAWYEKGLAGGRERWDLLATHDSQVYEGLDRIEAVPEAAPAVADTRGLVCTWDGPQGPKIFHTFYSSTCGGATVPADVVKHEPAIPPLAGNVACEYCRSSPYYRWEPVRFSRQTITARLRGVYPKFGEIGTVARVTVARRTRLGRPLILGIEDDRGRSIELEAENFRLAVDPTGQVLKSSWFRPISRGAAIEFTGGRGFGHGIGLCQYGADGLARQGYAAEAILAYYYPTSTLTRAY